MARVSSNAAATPAVIPAKVLRTLIVRYQDADRTLYASRYLYYFATDSVFADGAIVDAPADLDAASMSLPTEAH